MGEGKGSPRAARLRSQGRVWADPEDLDRWRLGQSSMPADPLPPRRSAWPLAASILAAAALTIAGLFALRPPPDPARVVHDRRHAVATDLNGRILWSHRFASVRESYSRYAMPEGVLADLDGDGQSEALVWNPAEPGHLEDNGLFCFSASGQIKWRFQPGKAVKTAQGVFEPPYYVGMAVPFRSPGNGPRRIAVVSIHSVYFPAQVAVLDHTGRLIREYWHAGHLHGLVAADLDNDGAPELYTAGVSNGHNNAVAIALDPGRIEGAGWEHSADYRFAGMKPGVEIARWLTPRTPFSRRAIRYNIISGIAAGGAGLVTSSLEYPPVAGLTLTLSFGPLLSNPSWSFSDSYIAGFDRLRTQGRLTTETPQSEARGAIGFRDATARNQDLSRSKTTERPAAQ